MVKRKLYNPEEIYLKRTVMPDFRSFEEISGGLILLIVMLEDTTFR